MIFAITARSTRPPVSELRRSLYTMKKSLNGRWMMLKRTFDLHCRDVLLYWMSAFRNILVEKP